VIRPFVALLAIEEQPTVDGRVIKKGALEQKKQAPVLRWTEDESPLVVGYIDRIYRVGNVVYGQGRMQFDGYVPGEALQIDVINCDVVDFDTPSLTISHGELARAQVGTTPAFPAACIVFLEES
jgi:hypothetical protein